MPKTVLSHCKARFEHVILVYQPCLSARLQHVHLFLWNTPGWKQLSILGLEIVVFLIAESHWFISFTSCVKAENPQFIQERRLFAIHGLFRLESKWNTSALIVGPKRKIFAMNGTSMRFTVPSSRLASFEWIFTWALRPQFTTVPNALPPPPRPLSSVKMISKFTVNSILRTASPLGLGSLE